MKKVSTRACDVAIVGAGPYGLSVAAYLRSAGVEHVVFGEPMEFWQHQMPRGMLLRSTKRACNIGGPIDGLRLDDYAASAGTTICERVRLADFTEYGHWFQREAAPNVDRRKVSQVETCASGFRLTLGDCELIHAQRLVVAAGIGPFAYRPPQFAGIPRTLVSHSSEHSEFTQFAGARVLVIGAGQSAFESAALLLESGADVSIVVRAPRVHWIRGGRSHFVHALLNPPTEVGPPGYNHLIARPRLFRILPRGLQKRLTYSAIRPMVSDWLEPRLTKARVETLRNVLSAVATREGLHLQFDDGSTRCVDHVVLATGYRIDISRYQFISSQLLHAVRTIAGYPVLTPEFESSVPGLFFVGAPATHSFGPLVRFVCGTDYCGKIITRSIISRVGWTIGRRTAVRTKRAVTEIPS